MNEVGCPSDSDSDGVLDGLDQCPETPSGAPVDEVGCPPDADGDGVYDGIDACPDTPAGAVADDQGCPLDSDGDGVLDGLDQCPDTPRGATVVWGGCPGDTDQDGVFDGIDRCPNTIAGQNVDEVGCVALFTVEEGIARPLILHGVNFESGQSRLTSGSLIVLDQVAAALLVHANIRVEIAGHTDSTGPRQLNRRLSQNRAQAVVAYLIRRGVPPYRMIARGYGPDNPIASNETEVGRARNRRVELRVLPSR